MANEIRMPQLSDTMDSGKILAWHKQVGDTVERGDVLAEVETDKADLEIESFQAGTLLQVVVAAGSQAQVGDVIAYIGAAGEDVPATSTPAVAPQSSVPTSPSTPQVSQQATEPAVALSEDFGRVKASPLAKKIATQLNVDLGKVTGTGPEGRIVKRDVETAAQQGGGNGAMAASTPTSVPVEPTSVPSAISATSSQSAPAATPVAPSVASTEALGGTLTPLSKMRQTIGKRMQQSVVEQPHFYVTTGVDMSEAVKLRALLKEDPDYKGITINHLIVKAVAYGIKNEPRVNYSVKDGQLFKPNQINVGIITVIEDGLLIPVVHQADQLSLRDVVFEARAAVDRARAGRPSSTDLMGGTFSISNMGMFDVESFTAIINPGQGAVLAVSRTKDKPVAEDGQLVIKPIMNVTISVDHRIIDGIMAGNFLKFFKQALEVPALLMA